MFKCLSRAGLVAATLLPLAGRAEDTLRIEQRKSDTAAKFYIDLGWVSLKNPDSKAVSGLTGGAGFVFGFDRRIGIVGGVQQSFSAQDSFSSLYTGLEVGGTFAILGSLRQPRTDIRLGGTPVFSQRGSGDVLRASVVANQYFLNGSSRVIGLAGIGAGLNYDYSISERFGISAGAKAAIASNGSTTIYPWSVGAGIFLVLGSAD